MAEVKLQAERREGAGKGPARRARAAGKVPAILYGHGLDPIPLIVDRREFLTALHTDAGMNVLLDLQVDGTEMLALTKELQQDPVKGTLLHADFVKVDRTQEVEVEVPITLVGEATGVKEGGILEHQLFTANVRCRATEVPQHIDVDVSALDVGDSVKVSDIGTERGYQILNDPETVVALVAAPISEAELEALEAGVIPEEAAEPEVEGEAIAEGEAPGEEPVVKGEAGEGEDGGQPAE